MRSTEEKENGHDGKICSYTYIESEQMYRSEGSQLIMC